MDRRCPWQPPTAPDPRCRCMPPALPAAYLAHRLPAAPPLGVARAPGPPGAARAGPRAAPAASAPPTASVSCPHRSASPRSAGAGVSRVSTRAAVLGANPASPARPLRQMEAAAGLGDLIPGEREEQTVCFSLEASPSGMAPAQGDVRSPATSGGCPRFCQALAGALWV